ncbi:MAG: hypothetical protein OEU50_07450 [Gammaproteobacteria bacterium]|nr:hypothetical protein [Gammaproteobacteria bacterium]
MFEFLFKYPAEYFGEGRFVSMFSWWQLALMPLAIAAIAFVLLGYFRLRGQTRGVDRMTIALLRGTALAMIVFSLSRPLLEVTARMPQPGVLGVLLDNSLSMGLADGELDARSDFITEQFDAASGELLRDLQQSFDVRLFKFGSETKAISDIGALDYVDGDSNLIQALRFAQTALQGEPLAGLVVIGDGAMQPAEPLDDLLLSLRSARIPVYSIGLGESRYARDIEISRVKLPDAVLNGSRVMADVSIKQQGYDGQTVELLVEDDSRILHKQQVRLQPGIQSLRIPLSIEDNGPRRLEFHLGAMADEKIAANNSRQAMLTVDNRKMRILYYEGEPRFELKFVRRAVADDKNLGVTGLIRTADAKFYRVGIESREALRNGFPITRDELFAYDAIILGSVENSLLSREQQDMIVEFVSERGGGLLMLGGRHAFSEGGHRDSVLQRIAPVVMPEQAQSDFTRQVRILPTEAALVHPALLIADSSEKSIARWLTLPPLTMVNPIRRIKPGATLLLSSPANEQDDAYVAMAWQRYGRGKVVAFPVQNSWLWQMHHEIELEDQTHELLWRQLLRWLVESVPRRLSLSLSAQKIHAGGVIELRSEVRQPDFSAQREAQPRAVLTAPDGSEQEIVLDAHPSLPGIYEGRLSVADPGDYLVRVELDEKGGLTRGGETRLLVTPAGEEYFHSEMNEKLLRRIADESNGNFFSARQADKLVDALDDNKRGSQTLLRLELWDMPLLFLLLVALLCAEWGYRRWRSLA